MAFPRILERMSADLDWTQRLGEAFLNDEALLLASVQTLRQRAYDAGSFDDMEKASISRDSGSIVIQPIEREVVYVPYYDSRKVYGNGHGLVILQSTGIRLTTLGIVVAGSIVHSIGAQERIFHLVSFLIHFIGITGI